MAQPYIEDCVGDCKVSLSPSQWSWVAASINLGAMTVGPCAGRPTNSINYLRLPSGWMVSRYGLKWTMVSLSLPFLAGWALIITATQAWMLDLGRSHH